MQKDRIFDKAKKLGISIDASLSDEENLEFVASEIGLNNYNADNLNSLENKLDNEIANNNSSFLSNESSFSDDYDDIQDYNSHNRFGEKEYNAAKDENGIYNSDYYKNRQSELDKKVDEAKEEKNKDYKEDESNINGKNKFDKLKDDVNLLDARKQQIENRINDGKSKIFRATHPEEIIKEKAKEAVNDLKNNVKEKAKNIIKKEGSNESKKVAGEMLLKNPKVRIAILIGAGLLLILLLFILAAANVSSPKRKIKAYCNSACDGFSITDTSLSKKEFVDKVKEYVASSNRSGIEDFSTYSGKIYDIATNANINPEIVLVRAINEGFSPGKEYNNYWGMGSYNGSSGGINYSSFTDGVKGFVENISQYDSTLSMMSKYTNIGKYWFNPGGPGLGGCYYFPHIREYMSEERAKEVERICNGASCAKDGSGRCSETTEEDQQAYAMWGVNKMVATREKAFGLSADTCNRTCYKGDYPIDPNDELYKNTSLLYDISFEELLEKNGMTIEKYNEFLYSAIEDAGIGTRDGVVAAATTLVGSMAEMGYRINYEWGGKHNQLGVSGRWGSYSGGSMCGHYANTFGEDRKSICTTNYKWFGFDCSGFVNWALKNGMQNTQIPTQTTSLSGGIALDPNNAVCKPGGVLVNEGHIILVVGIDVGNKQYITIESTGSRIDTNYGGNIISYKPFGYSGYVCKNLDEMYGD